MCGPYDLVDRPRSDRAVAVVLAAVAPILLAIMLIFPEVTPVLPTVPPILETVAPPAIVTAVPTILPPIPAVFRPVAPILAQVAAVLAVVAHILPPIPAPMAMRRSRRLGVQGRIHPDQQHQSHDQWQQASHLVLQVSVWPLGGRRGGGVGVKR